MFYEIGGERYRSVLKENIGEWVVCYDRPAAPVFVSEAELDTLKKIEVPDELFGGESEMSAAERERLEIIRDLIADNSFIRDRKERNQAAEKAAGEHGTTRRRVLNLYYRYLATGSTCRYKKRAVRAQKSVYADFDWAIRKYYYSAKRTPLRSAYDMMVLSLYADEGGKLREDVPSWNSFKHYFYRYGYHKNAQKEISRHGLSDYQRNKRTLFGSAVNWKEKIGYYQMDATIADIYLVSRYDRSTVVGRPYIYLAVDTVSQLIAGVYVGFDSSKRGPLYCLANAAMDKVSFCKKYGVEIEKADWPSENLPGGIITDQGREFHADVFDRLCSTYGMEIETLPPFRPDEKSLVEKSFDMLQARYKHLLRKRGVVEKDEANRWADDYRSQAVLTLDEFTQIIIYSILYVNSVRIQKSYVPDAKMLVGDFKCTASRIWNYFEGQGLNALIPVKSEQIYLIGLPEAEASISRKGIAFKGMSYVHPDLSVIMKDITGSKVRILYDENDVTAVFLKNGKTYTRFTLSAQSVAFNSFSQEECDKARNQIRQSKTEDTGCRIELLHKMKEVIQGAENAAGAVDDKKRSLRNQNSSKAWEGMRDV